MRRLAALALFAAYLAAQNKPVWTAAEQPIFDQLRGLRAVPDDARARVTKELALEIRGLPKTPGRLHLAQALTNLSTEGDFGRQTLQEVATTLVEALREQPLPNMDGEPADAYLSLAQLVRYEHVEVSLDAQPFQAALAKLAAEEQQRASADLTLPDLDGKEWNLHSLRGKSCWLISGLPGARPAAKRFRISKRSMRDIRSRA